LKKDRYWKTKLGYNQGVITVRLDFRKVQYGITYGTLRKYGIFISVPYFFPYLLFQCLFGPFSPKDCFFTVAVNKVKTSMLTGTIYPAVMVTAEYQLSLPI